MSLPVNFRLTWTCAQVKAGGTVGNSEETLNTLRRSLFSSINSIFPLFKDTGSTVRRAFMDQTKLKLHCGRAMESLDDGFVWPYKKLRFVDNFVEMSW